MKHNGFKSIADSYRKVVEQGKMTKEIAEPEIRIYDFLATCTQDDFCRLVDSSAFNDIIKAYLRMAVRNVNLDKKTENKLMNEISCLFDEMSASNVLINWQGENNNE